MNLGLHLLVSHECLRDLYLEYRENTRMGVFCDFNVSDFLYCLILATFQIWEGALVD